MSQVDPGTIRFLLMNSEYQKVISNRVEISTALNSWKRAVFLGLTAKQYTTELVSKQKEEEKLCNENKEIHNDASVVYTAMMYVSAGYLFNPYIILNCVGHTTTVFTNLLYSIALVSMTRSIFWNCLSISLLTLQGLYPVSLIVPTVIYIARSSSTKRRSNIANYLIVFASMLTILFCISYYIMGSWSFISNTLGFILTVPDLRPNVGLYWYFFTEVFEHFRWLFIASFQINVSLLYIVPLALRLRHDPMLLAFSYLAITAIFKSYPCIGDVGFYMSLLPLWKHLFQYTQQGFIVGCFMLFCTVFAPTVWYQWIYSRSANANFYFGVTLAFAIAQIFLLTDILFASVKHEFAVRHGINNDVSGNTAKLLLE
ncbi:phosphatidylinositol glycan anchor biosynthesis class U protein isoform X7 [Bombus pyrosoma]|uniref:phosphatidylinositol glycan anchor biosynthesis class U protein isoform X7 n=1 Tax=Bombus pyrosoma TaxID=396416 RepID=UPI001CB99663|nr:phosphatidylinositol glycan anchor biosynthesis class U protein isoform X7 [Bombus pyrosoma]